MLLCSYALVLLCSYALVLLRLDLRDTLHASRDTQLHCLMANLTAKMLITNPKISEIYGLAIRD
jgi:hypothetical protein